MIWRRLGADHQHVEAKSARGGLPRRLWETISAVANTTGGGTLILGISESEDFAVVGVQDPAKASHDLASICAEMMPPLQPLIEPHDIDGRIVISAEIPEVALEDKPCCYTGTRR